jgi:putative flippase GtrA
MAEPAPAVAMPGHRRSLPVYIAAGFAAVGGHYATTIALVELAGVAPLIASAIGFCVGATIKYFLNYFLAFRSTERHADALPKFVVALAVLFVLNLFVFWLLNERLGLHYFIAQVLTTGVLIAPGYVLSRVWVFAARRRARQP